MGISNTQTNFIKLEYKDGGSLDFPCDFCNSNSYKKNFWISENNSIKFVICADCLNKAKGEKLL